MKQKSGRLFFFVLALSTLLLALLLTRRPGFSRFVDNVLLGAPAIDEGRGVIFPHELGLDEEELRLNVAQSLLDSKHGGSVTAGYSTSCDSQPLRVYVYDIPRRLNFGVFDDDWREKLRRKENLSMMEGGIPRWPWNGEAHATAAQHNLEYYLTADIMSPQEVRSTWS